MEQLQKLVDEIDNEIETIRKVYQGLDHYSRQVTRPHYLTRLGELARIKKYIQEVLIPEAAYK